MQRWCKFGENVSNTVKDIALICFGTHARTNRTKPIMVLSCSSVRAWPHHIGKRHRNNKRWNYKSTKRVSNVSNIPSANCRKNVGFLVKRAACDQKEETVFGMWATPGQGHILLEGGLGTWKYGTFPKPKCSGFHGFFTTTLLLLLQSY